MALRLVEANVALRGSEKVSGKALTDHDANGNEQPDPVSIKAIWNWPESVPIQFSDTVIATIRDGYALFSFGQVVQPQFQAGDEDAVVALQTAGTLPIRSQFRSVVPLPQFIEFAKGIPLLLKQLGVEVEDSKEDDHAND